MAAIKANDTRVHLIVLALRLFRDHVLAGTGLGTFPQAWTVTEWVHDVSRRIDPHSFAFRFLAETGLLGTVPLFAWIARRGLRGLDRVFGSREDMAVTGLWAGTLAFFLHMCMDVDYVYAVAPVVLFFCLALLSTRTVTYNVFGRDDRRTMVRRRRIPCLVAGGLALVIALAPIQRGIASLYALRLGGLETATKTRRLTDAVVLDPGNDMYWNLLGATYAGALAGGVTGPVTDAARSAFARAQKLVPADYRAWWSQGMMELNLKSPAALTCLKEAERLYPTLAGIKGWLALAMVYVDGRRGRRGGESGRSCGDHAWRTICRRGTSLLCAHAGRDGTREGTPDRHRQAGFHQQVCLLRPVPLLPCRGRHRDGADRTRLLPAHQPQPGGSHGPPARSLPLTGVRWGQPAYEPPGHVGPTRGALVAS